MAIKIFNATETDYDGDVTSDLIIGNNLGNFISDARMATMLIFAQGWE